jgi:tRNA (mo5U34)-methyltransferase
MMRALHLLRQHCQGRMFLETHAENEFCSEIAAARYYSGSTLADENTNFWAPNRLCVLDMLHDTGFDVERDEAWGERLFAVAKAAPMEGRRSEKITLGYGRIGS